MRRFLLSRFVRLLTAAMFALVLFAMGLHGQSYVSIVDVPDYNWHAGCFGTSSGNLAGYWDRNGFPNFYTGPTGGGLAPLNTDGANVGIRSMWASQAGFDGRPANQPGHIDDYWVGYESIAQDPYLTAGREEHPADSIADFCGLNQLKWTNELMNGECIGNIDAFGFVYWDMSGDRRLNYTQTNAQGTSFPDVQSGLKAWSRYRGYDADVFSQLLDHRSGTPGRGFTFENFKAEINAGYPVLFMLQSYNEIYRNFSTTNRYNPLIHAVLAYGYAENIEGINQGVLIRTSWASGDGVIMEWNSIWVAQLPPRGVVGYHPKPKVTRITRNGENTTLAWDGPAMRLQDVIWGTTTQPHRYQLEKSATLIPANFQPLGAPTTERSMTITESGPGFYRVVLVSNQ